MGGNLRIPAHAFCSRTYGWILQRSGIFGNAGFASARQSDAPVVGAPALDAFLDLLAVEVVFEGLLGEFDHFVVGGKTEADELVLGEAIDLRVPFGGGEGLQAEAFFEADDAILNLEGIGAHLDPGDEDGDREDQEPSGMDVVVVIEVDEGEQEVGDQDEEEEEVEGRIEPTVVLQVLCCITHGGP